MKSIHIHMKRYILKIEKHNIHITFFNLHLFYNQIKAAVL